MTHPTDKDEVIMQLVVALSDAQQSLQTISMLAGRATYGNPPIESYMGHHDEVRAYATARAGCATEALTAGRAALAHPQASEPAQKTRLTQLKLLMITTAYEQGVGKGIQRRDSNPYAVDTDERDAWEIGYQEGASKASEPTPKGLFVDMIAEHGPEFVAEIAAIGEPAQGERDSEPMFWVRILNDGLYEGPVHNNSVLGKMMRDEKPDQWFPLYLRGIPPVGWTLVPIGDLKELYHSIHGNRFMGEDWEKKAIYSMMPKGFK